MMFKQELANRPQINQNIDWPVSLSPRGDQLTEVAIAYLRMCTHHCYRSPLQNRPEFNGRER